MELTELKHKIIESFTGLDTDLHTLLTQIENDHCIFPFKEYEYLICSLINTGGLTYKTYNAPRATDNKSDESLYMKALSRNTNRPFLMNFQQLKPQMYNVFIWVAVFRDIIILWIMNFDKVKNSPHYFTREAYNRIL